MIEILPRIITTAVLMLGLSTLFIVYIKAPVWVMCIVWLLCILSFAVSVIGTFAAIWAL